MAFKRNALRCVHTEKQVKMLHSLRFACANQSENLKQWTFHTRNKCDIGHVVEVA